MTRYFNNHKKLGIEILTGKTGPICQMWRLIKEKEDEIKAHRTGFLLKMGANPTDIVSHFNLKAKDIYRVQRCFNQIKERDCFVKKIRLLGIPEERKKNGNTIINCSAYILNIYSFDALISSNNART